MLHSFEALFVLAWDMHFSVCFKCTYSVAKISVGCVFIYIHNHKFLNQLQVAAEIKLLVIKDYDLL